MKRQSAATPSERLVAIAELSQPGEGLDALRLRSGRCRLRAAPPPVATVREAPRSESALYTAPNPAATAPAWAPGWAPIDALPFRAQSQRAEAENRTHPRFPAPLCRQIRRLPSRCLPKRFRDRVVLWLSGSRHDDCF